MVEFCDYFSNRLTVWFSNSDEMIDITNGVKIKNLDDLRGEIYTFSGPGHQIIINRQKRILLLKRLNKWICTYIHDVDYSNIASLKEILHMDEYGDFLKLQFELI